MAAYKDETKGTWYVSFHYYDWTGKNCRKLKRGFRTRKEALEWESTFLMTQSRSLDMKFNDFVKIYEADIRPKLKWNTWLTKEQIIYKKLIPYFGERKINDIKGADIMQWQNAMISYRDEYGEPYCPTYLRSMQAQLSCIFNHAVKFYDLKGSPAIKAGSLGKGTAEEMLFWTKNEYLEFIDIVKDKVQSYYAFQILYWCGLRVGELLALTYEDFDFEKQTIRINKSYQRLKGVDVITDPKTAKSKRTITMPDFLSNEMQIYCSKLYGLTNKDRIFCITKSFLHHEMQRGTTKSGVKKIKIHDLRHSHVSLLINMGFTAVAIGNRVGHESIDITYRYAHMFHQNRRKWQRC
jgi:integrase